MPPKSDGFRILIVDDVRELRAILEEYLADEGEVESAGDGAEALARHTATPYDLIITDLNMPGLNGLELIRKIRAFDEDAEFIIITAYASLDTAVEAVKVGAFDYIVKPFRIEEVKVVVKNAKDKIGLKKINAKLFAQLKSFYEELARYQGKRTAAEAPSTLQTEDIMREIKSLERLRRRH